MQPFYAQAVAGLSAFDLSKYAKADVDRATELFFQAQKLSDSGDAKGAIALYMASYSVVPGPHAAYNIAYLLDESGNGSQALPWYKRFFEGETRSTYASQIANAKKRIAALERSSYKKPTWLVPAVVGSAAFLVVVALMTRTGKPSFVGA